MRDKIESAMMVLDERFPDLAEILNPLRVVADDSVVTIATDGKAITYSPEFVADYPDAPHPMVVFGLANCACIIKFKHLPQLSDHEDTYWRLASTLVIAHYLEGRGLDVPENVFLPITVDSDEDIVAVYNRIMEKPIREMIDYQMTGKLYEGPDFDQSIFGQNGMTVDEANALRKDMVERVLSSVGPQPVPPMVRYREGITGADDACFEEE